MNAWVDTHYKAADEQTRILFLALLEKQDPDIMHLINGHYSEPTDRCYEKILEQLRSHISPSPQR